MNYKILLDTTANILENSIVKDNGMEIETEDFGWGNIRYISNSFRMAHIERYSDKSLEVLHVACFPHIHCGDPIFGFDIICTDKKPLAAFIDLSPVTYHPKPFIDYKFKTPYPLPEWSKSIFSDHVIAIRPDIDEIAPLCYEATNLFESYIKTLGTVSDSKLVVEAQNYYCEQQSKNERTYNVLKAKLGEERAEYFMNTILFPKIIEHGYIR
jgi:phycocyanobilin:ferredoxin oxidoreductase